MNYLSNTVRLSCFFTLMVIIKICLPAPVPPNSIKNDISNVVVTTKQRIYSYKDEMQEIIKFVDDYYALVTKEPITEKEINVTIKTIESAIEPFKIRETVTVQYKVQNWSVRSSRPFDMYEYLFYLVPTIDQKSLETLLKMQNKVQNGWLQFKTIVGLGDDVPMVLHNVWYNGRTDQANVSESKEMMSEEKKPEILWTTEKLTTENPITTMMMSPTTEILSSENQTSELSSTSTVALDLKESTTVSSVNNDLVEAIVTSTQRSNMTVTTIKSEKLVSTTEKISEIETTTETLASNEISNEIETTTILDQDSLTTEQPPESDDNSQDSTTELPESTTEAFTETSTIETSTLQGSTEEATTLSSTSVEVTTVSSLPNTTVSRTDNYSSNHNTSRLSKFLWTTEASNVIEKPLLSDSFLPTSTNHITSPILTTKNKEQAYNINTSYSNKNEKNKHHVLNKEEGALNLRARNKNVTQQHQKAANLLFAFTAVLNQFPV